MALDLAAPYSAFNTMVNAPSPDVIGGMKAGYEMQGANLQNQKTMADIGLTQANTGLTQAQTAQTGQQTQNLAAQNPGLIADSATKVRTLAGAQWFGNHMDQFKKADGSFDVGKATAFSTAAGFGDLAPEISKTWLANQGQEIKNASDAQGWQKAQDAMINGTKQTTANALAALPPTASFQDRLNTYNQYRQGLIKSGVNPGVVNDTTFPEMTSKEQLDSWVTASKWAPTSALDKSNLAINQQNANTASQNANTARLGQNQSAASNIISATKSLNNSQLAKTGSNMAMQVFSGVENVASLPIDEWKKRIERDPAAGQVQQAIAAYNADHPGENMSYVDGMKSISERLNNYSTQQAQASAAYADVAKQGGAQSAMPQAPAPTGIPGSTGTQSQMMIRPKDGKPVMVKAGDVNHLKSLGWKMK